MSSSLAVYFVPWARLETVCGSRDDSLQRLVLDQHVEWIMHIDQLTQKNVKEELEGYPTFLDCATAIGQIFSGELPNPQLGIVYTHAYEMICATLSIDNPAEWHSIARSGEFFDSIDRWLSSITDVSMTNLACRGPVINIPSPIDFPSVGYWTPGQIPEASKRLRVALNSKWPWFRNKPPEDLASSVSDIYGWICTAQRQKGVGLVGVHHY